MHRFIQECFVIKTRPPGRVEDGIHKRGHPGNGTATEMRKRS